MEDNNNFDFDNQNKDSIDSFDDLNDSNQNNNQNNNSNANDDTSSASESDYAFNWSYEQMHEPINFDAPVKQKRNGKKFAIIIGIVFAVAIFLLAAAILSELQLATPDDLKGQTNVNINVSDSSPTPLEDGSASPEALENFKNSVVVVSTDTSTGTGIIFTKDGYIVTNHHVIESASSVQVILYSGETYRATVVGHIESNDIAVLKIAAQNLTPATFAKSESCYLGQRVYAVGNPAGANFSWSITSGIISSTNREAKFYDENNLLERKMKVIQTDTPVNPGNSGGPLINSSCQVLGIITMRLANDYVGMSFAIPSDEAIKLITKILSGEGDKLDGSDTQQTPPQMGIVGTNALKGLYYTTDNKSGQVTRVSETYAKNNPDTCFSPSADGIYILQLTPGLDAANKLQVGDVIVDIENSGNKDMDYLRSLIQTKKSGDSISLTIDREGNKLDVEIILK